MDLTQASKFEYFDTIKETDNAKKINCDCGCHWFPNSVHRIVGNVLYVERWFVKQERLHKRAKYVS